MKILTIIPLTLVPLININKGTTPLPFETISVSPFYRNKDSTIVVVTKSTYLKFYMCIQNDKYSDLQVLAKEIRGPGTYTYTYSNTYTRDKNKIYFKISTGPEYVNTPLIDRNLEKPNYEYLLDNKSITSNSTIAVFKGDLTYTTRKINYNFEGFEGLYVPPYFHKIDLSNFKIKLPKTDHPFFDCTASLVIKNFDSAFDGISGSEENATFNLKLLELDDGFTFSLSDEFYVDIETLKMYTSNVSSSTVKTNHVYFPRNEMRNQDKYECYLMISDFGIDKDSVIHRFVIHASKNIMGDCRNSQYCIIKE